MQEDKSSKIWTPESLIAVFRKDRAKKEPSIIDGQGRTSENYTDWGEKVTRTPDVERP